MYLCLSHFDSTHKNSEILLDHNRVSSAVMASVVTAVQNPHLICITALKVVSLGFCHAVEAATKLGDVTWLRVTRATQILRSNCSCLSIGAATPPGGGAGIACTSCFTANPVRPRRCSSIRAAAVPKHGREKIADWQISSWHHATH